MHLIFLLIVLLTLLGFLGIILSWKKGTVISLFIIPATVIITISISYLFSWNEERILNNKYPEYNQLVFNEKLEVIKDSLNTLKDLLSLAQTSKNSYHIDKNYCSAYNNELTLLGTRIDTNYKKITPEYLTECLSEDSTILDKNVSERVLKLFYFFENENIRSISFYSDSSAVLDYRINLFREFSDMRTIYLNPIIDNGFNFNYEILDQENDFYLVRSKPGP